MKRMLVLLAALISLPLLVLAAQHVAIGQASGDVNVTLLESSAAHTVVRFDVSGYSRETVSIGGQDYFLISCGKEAVLLNAGKPELPHVSRSVIIPDDGGVELNVVASSYVDYPNVRVAPSKGNLLRTVDPATVPYVFGPAYLTDQYYPADLAAAREPYILRDLRGTVIDVNPFQYNPARQTLRVYTSVTVEVNSIATASAANVLQRVRPFDRVDPAFDQIYRRHFLNYGDSPLLYTPVVEQGELLIITYDAFHSTVQPLANWKIQKGIKTTIVDVSTIGTTYSVIRTYIQNFYNNPNNDLAYVLLVGDAAQVASPPSPAVSTGHGADPIYSTIGGADGYPDIFVGRFSAENVTQVATQVERSVEYERDAQASAWYHLGTGIGSDQGPGHNGGEYDYVHENGLRTDLLGFTYTAVDQIYDPSATAAQVSAALNAGRSFVNYTGHGSQNSWGTTGFNNSNVAALTNDNLLPFIFSVACVNGDFTGATCFAEAWLRSTHNGQPIGAVATYMASINQSWNPPMDAQDECTDLLVAQAKTTVGGLFYNASCRMLDLNSGTAGTDMFYTWHIFGDPSIQVRTATPSAMTVGNDPQILYGSPTYTVTAVAGALCGLSHDGVYYGSAYANASGIATINVVGDLPIAASVTLTVTAFNKLTYIADIPVITGGPDVYPPNVSLTPLPNTNDPAGPYSIRASVRDMSGVASATLRYGFDSLSYFSVAMTRDTGTSWVASFGGFPAGSRVFYYVSAVDSAEAANTGSTPVYHFSVLGTIFEDNMEAGQGSWTSEAITAGWGNQWHVSATRSHSGTHAWKSGDTGTGGYSIHTYGGLMTPPLALRGEATLSFWHWMIAERSTLYSDSAYDGGCVDIQVDNGVWNELAGLAPVYNRVIRCTRGSGTPATTPFSCRTPVYSDTIPWTQVTVNLDSYAGHTIRLRWRFGTDSSTAREGWYVDDVSIVGLPPEAPAPNAVSDLTVLANLAADSVRLVWTSTGAASYQVFSSNDINSPYETLEMTVSGTTVSLPAGGLRRYYTVIASSTPARDARSYRDTNRQ